MHIKVDFNFIFVFTRLAVKIDIDVISADTHKFIIKTYATIQLSSFNF